MVIKGLRIIFPTREDRQARRALESAMRDDLERRLLSNSFGLFR
ncbi:MAG: hypothetical protein WAJ85_08530 [Candidatus Baltobacteraceae bacterium]|jgi:hypothetical protein